MKKMFAVCMIVALFVSGLFAQDTLPTQSEAMLRTYALEQSYDVAAQINTPLPDDSTGWGYTQIEESSVAGISNAICGMSLAVTVANPNDRLYLFAGAFNEDGDALFTGWKQFYLVKGKGGYALPEGYGNVTLTLCDTIPIRISGAQAAVVNILGADGETKYGVSVRVEDEKVYYPRQLAGTNAVLAVYTWSSSGSERGHWRYWDVRSGCKITPEQFGVTVNPMIEGVVSVTDQSEVTLVVPTTKGVGKNLTVEYKSTGKLFVGFTAQTTEGKWFTGAWVRKAGTSEWVHYAASVTADAVFIDIPVLPGIYYIVPSWNPEDLTEPKDPWYPPYYGEGGKS